MRGRRRAGRARRRRPARAPGPRRRPPRRPARSATGCRSAQRARPPPRRACARSARAGPASRTANVQDRPSAAVNRPAWKSARARGDDEPRIASPHARVSASRSGPIGAGAVDVASLGAVGAVRVAGGSGAGGAAAAPSLCSDTGRARDAGRSSPRAGRARAARGGGAAGAGAGPPARSSRSKRSSRAAGEGSSSGRARRTTRDLQDDRRVGCLAHLDHGAPERLQGADRAREAERLTELGEPGAVRPRRVGRRRGRAAAGRPGAAPYTPRWRAAARSTPPRSSTARAARTSVARSDSDRGEQLVEGRPDVVGLARGDDLVERAQRVARRAVPATHRRVEGVVGDVERRGVADVGQEPVERLAGEEPELEVLGAAPQRRWDLLRVRRREHEDDVGRRLLDGLQQRVRRGGREHVDLVDDVDLPPPGRAERGVVDEVSDRVDAVRRGGVELGDVERGAPRDLDAAVAHPAGLAVLRLLAVERLGEDPGRGRLPGAPRPAEQVRVRDAVGRDRGAQRAHDVVLATKLGEGPGAEPAVERGDAVGAGAPTASASIGGIVPAGV